MKNVLGLLHVIGLCLFYVLIVTFFVLLVISFYGFMAVMVFVILTYLYIWLGTPWFFIVVPVLLLALAAFQNRKWLKKRLGR